VINGAEIGTARIDVRRVRRNSMSMFRASVTNRTFLRAARSPSGLASEKSTINALKDPLPSMPLAGLDSLVGRRWHDGQDVRPTLLRVLTDLYIQKPSHSPDEELQYVELALRLLEAVDISLRAEVARKLATYRGAPAAILRRLAFDSSTLIGGTMNREPSGQPDRRQSLSVATEDAVSPDSSFVAIARELDELFFTASPAERRLIMVNLDYSNATPSPPMSDVIVGQANRGLESAALQGRLDEFIRELERAMMISREQAQRIVNDPSGEPLVVAARALTMPIDTLQRILLCVNPAIGHSVRRVFSLSALYKDMSLESALRLVAIWRAAAPATRASADYRPTAREAASARDLTVASRRAPSRVASDTSRPRHHVTR
jgi:hypothetical protein